MKASRLSEAVLFTDLRHICCGDLEWCSPGGDRLPAYDPPEPRVDALARTGLLPRGVRLVSQAAEKTDPLNLGSMLDTHPLMPYMQIVFESGIYRAWYLRRPTRAAIRLSEATSAPAEICHADSQDGFAWTETARCPIDSPARWPFDGFSVFVDPVAPPQERYKAVYSARPPREKCADLWREYAGLHPRYRRDTRLTQDRLWCIYSAVSPDGLHWEPVHQPLMVHEGDTDNTVYYDPWLGRYVLYTRLYMEDRRWIGRAEAEDFYHWGPVTPLIGPGLDSPLSDDLYLNGRTEYPGLPAYHLMFPTVYHRYTQSSHVHLFSSADGISWKQVPGGPILSPSDNRRDWDSEFITGGKNLVPLGQDRIAIPYRGTGFPHKYPRWTGVLEATRTAWAWWPRGRLCAAVADEEGEFFSGPVARQGRELLLNVRTRRGGEVRVGLLGVRGRGTQDCDPIYGDSPAVPVVWRGETELTEEAGQSVVLHFRLRAAELFGYEWA